MKFIAFCLLICVAEARALDSEEIRDLAAEPHSREALDEHLRLYPDAREYRITVSSGMPGEKLEEVPEIVAKEKTVRGRYIVSELRFPGEENPLIMVVSYEKKSDTFKKWVLLPNGVVAGSTGVADFENRTIAWISNKEHGDPPTTVLSIETHSDDKTSWKESVLQATKVVRVSRGIAIKTK